MSGEEARKKRKEKEKQARLKKLNERLKQPLFKKGKRTKTKGNNLQISVSAGVSGLLGV